MYLLQPLSRPTSIKGKEVGAMGTCRWGAQTLQQGTAPLEGEEKVAPLSSIQDSGCLLDHPQSSGEPIVEHSNTWAVKAVVRQSKLSWQVVISNATSPIRESIKNWTNRQNPSWHWYQYNLINFHPYPKSIEMVWEELDHRVHEGTPSRLLEKHSRQLSNKVG